MGDVHVLAPLGAETGEQMLTVMQQQLRKLKTEGVKDISAVVVLIYKEPGEEVTSYRSAWSSDTSLVDVYWAGGMLQRRVTRAVEE